MIEENHEKTSVRLVGTGIWTRDLPNASLVRYHGATSLGKYNFLKINYAKLTEGIFIEPQIRLLLWDDEHFEELLHPLEKAEWKSFKNIWCGFFDNNKE